MQNTFQVFKDIDELLTLKGVATKDGRKITKDDLTIVRDAVIIAHEGKIRWIGAKSQQSEFQFPKGASIQTHSLDAKTVMPAFVECHTHSVFAGNRAQEFEWRQLGQSYQEIAAKGGGILSTVQATREASESELLKLAHKRAQNFVEQGVTTLEIKSGYGLSLESEMKILKVARQVTGPRIMTTYLGAHSRAPEQQTCDAYLTQILEVDLKQIKASGLADRADIYIEKGFFSTENAKAFFRALKDLDMPFTAHVEQLSSGGGIATALQYKPQSVDHAVFASDTDIAQLATSDATVVLLPTSDLYLKMQYPPARQMIEKGVRVALATDFNPGTSPTQDLSLVGVLARLQMGMSLPQVIAAYTYGAAASLGKDRDLGSLEVGKLCDFVALEDSWESLFYSIGHHPVSKVWKEGVELYKSQ